MVGNDEQASRSYEKPVYGRLENPSLPLLLYESHSENHVCDLLEFPGVKTKAFCRIG